MGPKTSSPASAFAKALRSFETGGFTYNDFLAELKRLLATGASPTELLAVLRRREFIEPLPDYAQEEVLGLLNVAMNRAAAEALASAQGESEDSAQASEPATAPDRRPDSASAPTPIVTTAPSVARTEDSASASAPAVTAVRNPDLTTPASAHRTTTPDLIPAANPTQMPSATQASPPAFVRNSTPAPSAARAPVGAQLSIPAPTSIPFGIAASGQSRGRAEGAVPAVTSLRTLTPDSSQSNTGTPALTASQAQTSASAPVPVSMRSPSEIRSVIPPRAPTPESIPAQTVITPLAAAQAKASVSAPVPTSTRSPFEGPSPSVTTPQAPLPTRTHFEASTPSLSPPRAPTLKPVPAQAGSTASTQARATAPAPTPAPTPATAVTPPSQPAVPEPVVADEAASVTVDDIHVVSDEPIPPGEGAPQDAVDEGGVSIGPHLLMRPIVETGMSRVDKATKSGATAGAIGLSAAVALLGVVAWFFVHHAPASTKVPAASSAAVPNPGTLIRDCPTCPAMTVLPAGRFKQGSARVESGSSSFEKPQHWVVIGRPLAMSTNLVTVNEFRQFIAATGRGMQGCDTYDGEWKHRPKSSWKDPGFIQTGTHPVTCSSWNDADVYAQWLSTKTGHRYRLPSASEWEYAARAGGEAVRPWNPNGSDACAYANVADKRAAHRYPGWLVFACDDGYVNTSPVGSFKPNPFGLNDMLGNVFQWTQDCWYADYTGAPADGSARTDGNCSERELRGGSWFSSPAYVRANYRNHFAADYRTSSVGIRLVRDIEQ